MKLQELRQLIRKTVKAQLAEAKKIPGAPDSFNAFRIMLADALHRVNAPQDLVEEVADLDYEGSPIGGALYRPWQNIEYELNDPHQTWEDIVEFYVHDAVIDMVDSYKNGMNYEPGATKGRKKIDGPTLAAAVTKVMIADTKKKSI